MPLHKALFVETSPGPVKYGASLLGRAPADDAPADLRDRRPLEGGRALRHDLGRTAELRPEGFVARLTCTREAGVRAAARRRPGPPLSRG